MNLLRSPCLFLGIGKLNIMLELVGICLITFFFIPIDERIGSEDLIELIKKK